MPEPGFESRKCLIKSIFPKAIQAYVVLLCCAFCVLQILPFFYTLKVFGDPTSSKSGSAIFPMAFAYIVSPYHTLVILTLFQAFSLLLCVLCDR